MRKTLITIIILIVAITFTTTSTKAQDDSATANGLTPYQAFHGGDLDSVNLNNGNVVFSAPIISYPQRGNALTMNFVLTINTKILFSRLFCRTQTSCITEWGSTDTPPLIQVVPDQNIGLTEKSIQTFRTPAMYKTITEAITADGSYHLMGFVGSGLRSLDGTGIYVDGVHPGIFDNHAVHYAPATNVLREDANGNQIIYDPTAGVYRDTLNRPIPPIPPVPPNPNNPSPANFVGCTGPLTTIQAVIWAPPGPNGGTSTFKFCYANLTTFIPTGAAGPNSLSVGPSTSLALQSIVLPNGTSWSFEYNDRNVGDPSNVNYGTITQINLPTGGSISYTFVGGTLFPCSNSVSRFAATRIVDANDGTGPHAWTYTRNRTNNTTTVTDPLGNDTVHTFTDQGSCTFYETQSQVFQGSSTGGTLLKTVNTDYSSLLNPMFDINGVPVGPGAINVVPIRISTTWPNGKVTKQETDYDTGFTFNGPGPVVKTYTGIYGEPIAKREFDYGSGTPGPLIRTTTTAYQFQTVPAYLTNNLLTLPASITATGGSLTGHTTFNYDEAGGLVSSGITTQHDSAPPTGTARGNRTSIHRQLNNGSATAAGSCPAVSSGGYLVTNAVFFDTGEVNVSKDPCLRPTTFAYSGTYFGAFPTTVTNVNNQSTTNTFDLNTGLLNSTTDPNGQTATFTYDSMWRFATATYSDGGSAAITYQENSIPYTATLTKKITSSLNYVTTNIFDGLGRVSQSQVVSDLPSTTYTVINYDADGRTSRAYNPTRCNPPTTNCGESTWGFTAYAQDALNRITSVTESDGSILQSSYAGNSTTVTDEAGRKRTSFTDGLGRLTQVFEDPSGLNYETDYVYDSLNDLTSVAQSGSRQRTFAYDSLDRLTSSSNPESGTVTYTYDADGNVLTRLDARGTKTTYTYDQLNRVLSKAYTDTTPSVTYAYDGNAPTCTTGVSSYGLSIGRRTAMCDGPGFEAWIYNDITNVGWQITDKRNTNGLTESTVSQNNLSGTLLTQSYPSGRTITYTYNGAGRPTEAEDVANGILYVGNGTYLPNGSGLTLLSFGTHVNVDEVFNPRLQPCWIYATVGGGLPANAVCTSAASTGSIMDLKYNFSAGSDNGNLAGVTNDRFPNRSQAFTYDSLNRILTASTTATHATDATDCWGEAYVYDNQSTGGGAWGNLTNINVASTAYTGCTQEGLSVAANTKNQFTVDGYDAAGNMTSTGTASYVYNAENELTSAAGVTYKYDGDGKRVSKSSGKVYWYGGKSDPITETDTSGNTTDEYIFLGGRRVARRDPAGNIVYYMADHLGTSRIVTDTSGNILDQSDFYPFGGERVITASSGNAYKFTGKERDTESGLDNFGVRYDSSSMGRFMSPDNPKFSEKADPQTWNLYSYVGNNPLARIDPIGTNWFNINGTWQWFEGADVTNSGTPCVHGAKGCNHSDYTHLLVVQKLDSKTDKGATKVQITLYNQNQIIVQGTGFTGATNILSVPNGKYEINLNHRGGVDTNRIVATAAGLQLGPFHDGIQEVGDSIPYHHENYSATGEWGTLRANLSRGEDDGTQYYLHGKGLYFTEGHSYTAGCICDPSETVLRAIFKLDPSGVGQGEKNGRIAVSVNKPN